MVGCLSPGVAHATHPGFQKFAFELEDLNPACPHERCHLEHGEILRKIAEKFVIPGELHGYKHFLACTTALGTRTVTLTYAALPRL